MRKINSNGAIVITQIGEYGPSGFSGFSGYSGYSGFSGASGSSGVSGASGCSGHSGISGFSGAASPHNELIGLQGGTASEYYHLTQSQHAYISSGILSGAITSGMLGNGSVVSGSIASGSIGTNHLSSGIKIKAPSVVFDGVNVQSGYDVTLDKYMDYIWSAGRIYGFDLSEDGDGKISLTGGAVMLRSSDSTSPFMSPLLPCYVAATPSISLTDNDTNYVYADYNGGSPQISVTTDVTTITGLSTVLMFVITRTGTELDYISVGSHQSNFMSKYARKKFAQNYGMEYGYGSLVTESDTRKIAVSPGAFYISNEQVTVSAFDSNVSDTFTTAYRDGADSWFRATGQTALGNTQYNRLSDNSLQTLGNNKYGVYWVYWVLDTPNRLVVVYGQDEYASHAEASAAGIPASLPPELLPYTTGVLIAKVIFREGGTNFYEIQNPFETHLRTSIATTHNDLAGLQGGTVSGGVGEYYHLTQSQHAYIASGILSGAITSGMLGNGAVVSGSIASGTTPPLLHSPNHKPAGIDPVPNGLGTGLLNGGLLSINGGDNTKYDITAGCGIVVDNYTNPSSPSITFVQWTNKTAVSDPLIGTLIETYVLVDSTGTFSYQSTHPTPTELRSKILIGWLSHIDGATLDYAYTEPVFAADAGLQLDDFLKAFGQFNITGNVYSPSSGLMIGRTGGSVWDAGVNYATDSRAPHELTTSTQDPVSDIFYFYRDGGTGWVNDTPVTDEIDPEHWDDDSGTLQDVPAGEFTIQYITYYGLWDATDIQYGQATYPDLATAEAAVADSIETNPWNAEWDVVRGWLIIQQGCTDITDPTKAKFITASKFASTTGGGGAGGETNTASNVGLTGVGLYLTKFGVDLQFKNIDCPTSGGLVVTNNVSGSTVDISLASGGVTSGYLGDSSVVSGSIASGQVSINHLASGVSFPNNLTSGGVKSGHLGNGAVISGSVASGQISLNHLASGVIQANNITSGGVTSGDLGNGTVVSGSIASGQVSLNHLASGVSFSNNLTSGGVRSGHLGNGAVVSGSLASGQIGFNHLSSGLRVTSGSIIPYDLANAAVLSANIASGQVGTYHLASGVIPVQTAAGLTLYSQARFGLV